MQAGGQRFESVILHVGSLWDRKFYDILYSKTTKQRQDAKKSARSASALSLRNESSAGRNIFYEKEVKKGARRMPRLLQAKKDVISCEKPRVGANDH